MKFPYGISDFQKIIRNGYYYCDRTDRLAQLEDAGDYLLFIRPRRFGKSLLLSMLRNYYDVAQKDRYDELFGHLKIGQHPTPLRNRYFILQWDFSCVDPTGTVENIRRALYNHVNARIHDFSTYYKNFLPSGIRIHSDDAISSFGFLLTAVREAGLPLYLLIDEYDNFANEVMTGIRDERDVYKALVHEKGPLKTLFKAVKSAAGEGKLDRLFITGVSPIVMSDITSGFNIAQNIYLLPDFNDLCGFTESEVTETIREVATACGFNDTETDDVIRVMRTYYNGYTFSPESDQRLYNPTLTLYFAGNLSRYCTYPRNMLDANLATDEAKLEYIAQLPRGRQMILNVTRGQEPAAVTNISDRFGIRDMLADNSRDHAFIVSFLYYFGVLTIAGIRFDGKLELRVPNLVMRGLYVDRIQRMLLPEPDDRDEGVFAAEQLYGKGDMQPLCDFLEQRYFQVFHNPDYKWANELTIKTAFLTLLYNDTLYIMDSEQEAGRGYADLTMIIRPDMRQYEIFDILIEFKYVKPGDTGLTGEAARNLTQKELQQIPAMMSRMKEARKQVKQYGASLEKKFQNLKLRQYAVVSLGFERIWWEEVRM